ncbi:MAG: glycosidase [Bacillota bacterium]
MHFTRRPENPIVVPGKYDWRMAVVFNPGVLYDEGKFYLYERAAGGLRPFHCYIGLLESDDGIHFRHVSSEPIFTPEMAGSKYGSVQDPRVVHIGDTYYMTYAYRPFAWSSHPTGLGVPESYESEFPGVLRPPPIPSKPGSPNVSGARPDNMTRSGIAISKDRVHWKHYCWPTSAQLDDRDVILFPEKINGRFALLRRPLQFVGPEYGTEYPAIWISYSEDLLTWSKPELVAKAAFKWEDNRIGGSTPPIRTNRGWLMLYHGVENQNPATKRVVYRLGAMLLDLNDPRKVIARTSNFIMEPEMYYERFGLYIPNVIFPTGNVVKDGLLYLYYGACDTAICLATVPLDELVDHVMKG